MKFSWSIVLLASIVFAVAGPIFFGHALIAHDGAWFAAAAICVAIAAVLFFVQKRFATDDGHAHH
jgi:hypothetical protein